MTTPEQPPSLPGGIGPDRQLGTEAGRLERVAQQARGLVEDVKEWVDLKLQLVQVQVEERIEQKVNQAVLGLLLALVALLAVVFLLTAAALGLGAWLGHPAWGFLIVAGVLFVTAGVLHAARPRLVKMREPAPPSPEQPAVAPETPPPMQKQQP